MLEVAPTSIQSQKGMRAQHPRLSRSRRDTPSKGPGCVETAWDCGAGGFRPRRSCFRIL